MNGAIGKSVLKPMKCLAKTTSVGFGVLLLFIAITFSLNYFGFCFDELRFKSEQERIQSFVETAVLDRSKITTFAYDSVPKQGFEIISGLLRCEGSCDVLPNPYDGSSGGEAISATQLVPYRDAREFFRVNPDCCSFTRDGLYGEVVASSFWAKITGYSAGFVNVKFRVRYRDEAGLEKIKYSAVSSNQTNCGISVNPLFD